MALQGGDSAVPYLPDVDLTDAEGMAPGRTLKERGRHHVVPLGSMNVARAATTEPCQAEYSELGPLARYRETPGSCLTSSGPHYATCGGRGGVSAATDVRHVSSAGCYSGWAAGVSMPSPQHEET